jgi:hypothetical protein
MSLFEDIGECARLFGVAVDDLDVVSAGRDVRCDTAAMLSASPTRSTGPTGVAAPTRRSAIIRPS